MSKKIDIASSLKKMLVTIPTNDQVSESRHLLLKTAHINGAVLSEEVMAKTLESAKAEAQNENSKTFTILDLFKHKNLCLKTCILSLTWIVTSALYYVLLLDQSELSDDHFSGFVATALIQIPGYIYVILTLERPQVWSLTHLSE